VRHINGRSTYTSENSRVESWPELNKRKGSNQKVSRKPAAKGKRTAKKEKTATSPARPSKVARPTLRAQPAPTAVNPQKEQLRERPSFEIIIDRIHGGTVLGDLMVVFPRTREVLKKYGLNLEVDEAGDIYMSLEAFAALKGIKTESVIQELEAASKEPPPATAPAITVQTIG
jgi:hypothetical protein